MINVKNARKFCCEEISLIENYCEAVSDSQTWQCHHRGEILPCGNFSKKSLVEFGLYYGRPAQELVFLKTTAHRRLHTTGRNNPFYGRRHSVSSRMANSAKHLGNRYCVGRVLSDDSKDRIRMSHLGTKASEKTRMKLSEMRKGMNEGTRWWTDGFRNVRSNQCPSGFVPGLTRVKGK